MRRQRTKEKQRKEKDNYTETESDRLTRKDALYRGKYNEVALRGFPIKGETRKIIPLKFVAFPREGAPRKVGRNDLGASPR